jgi:hypothetical protein
MYSLVVGDTGPKVRRYNLLYRSTTRVARSHDLDSVLDTLRGDLKLHVAAFATSRVFVHAGVVGWRGRAIVLPGRTYAGKSTLVAALVRAGARYYSDEYAVLDRHGRVHPFPSPLTLRSRPGEPLAETSTPSSELAVGRRALPVGLVVLTHYKPEARWRTKVLSPGAALLALMESTVPVWYQPEATLRALKAVVTSAPVVKGVRGEAEEAVEKLLSM